MEEIEYQWLSDFLGEEWRSFIKFLSDREEDNEKAEETAERINSHLRKCGGVE